MAAQPLESDMMTQLVRPFLPVRDLLLFEQMLDPALRFSLLGQFARDGRIEPLPTMAESESGNEAAWLAETASGDAAWRKITKIYALVTNDPG